MNTQVLDDLQLLGLDETVTVAELKRRWRFLSSHTHPDRYAVNTPEFEKALARQKTLNNAKDRILVFIKDRDSNLEDAHLDREADRTDPAPAEAKEQSRETNNTQATQDPQETTVSTPLEASSWTLESHTLQECFTLLVFFGCMFTGVLAAVLVSAVLPLLATTAPIILVAVMLITMAGAMFKIKQWTENSDNRIS